MSYPQTLKRGVVISLVMSLLIGCAEASSPTTIELPPLPTSTALPPPPRVIVPQPTPFSTLANTGPYLPADTATADATGTVDGTTTFEPSSTLPPPVDRPFMMRIDRISVVTGRGILLSGRVANGTLQEGASVELLGSQNVSISANLLAILVANAVREQVTVGDYAGILVGGVDATSLSPGMLLAAAGEYESYEEALRQLR